MDFNLLDLTDIDFSQIGTAVIDTAPLMAEFLDTLVDLPTSPPSLYLDLEGINLGRKGTLAIVQVFVAPRNRAYLIDVHVLGEKAFSTKGSNGETFRGILESKFIPKVFFDVRNDSDALYSHFQVRLSCVVDVQLMELATRDSSKKRVRGLATCILNSGILRGFNKMQWEMIKKDGKEHFTSAEKGNREVWNERPQLIVDYSVQDVTVLPWLWVLYDKGLSEEWRGKVEEETVKRVKESQSVDYVGEGNHKTLGPDSWSDREEEQTYLNE
ncbi:hypothetical protein MMC30_008182 [Trapelia coarctata]|nr:hypothetical protein [Trapelia coarctata]